MKFASLFSVEPTINVKNVVEGQILLAGQFTIGFQGKWVAPVMSSYIFPLT
jgi:hypothetical protein